MLVLSQEPAIAVVILFLVLAGAVLAVPAVLNGF
jgi:hypothetical protein